mmetsp:Transcript_4237/g.10281  ORF Transcript_4237/g.10281 Transcript_4237/m.10281 type:complete len:213 (+) Transcript_4237:113-751(+)
MRECVANSASSPMSPSCFSTNLVVSGRLARPALRASCWSRRWTILPQPISSSFSRSIQELFSSDLLSHLTSYSYERFVLRRDLSASMMRFSTVPSSLRMTWTFSRLSSSSLVIFFASCSLASLSSPELYLHWMYSLGVLSRWFSKWWNACCATYATRMFWWRHTVPSVGFVSPQNILMIVDLPAPLGPTTATLDDSDACSVTLRTVGLSRPG